MWKILGEETVIPGAADTWRKRVVELSKKIKNRDRFLALIEKGDMRVVLDGVRETWMFIINLPEDAKREDIEFVANSLQALDRAAKKPLMELDGKAAKASIVVTTEEYTDDYGVRRTLRAETKKEEAEAEKKTKKATKTTKKSPQKSPGKTKRTPPKSSETKPEH
jgi:hypothetical protein